jgi:hypothetical protein
VPRCLSSGTLTVSDDQDSTDGGGWAGIGPEPQDSLEQRGESTWGIGFKRAGGARLYGLAVGVFGAFPVGQLLAGLA